MVIRIAPQSITWFADLVDHMTPDSMRSGDLYDVMSGRFALQSALQFSPFAELADGVSVRRARAKDLTSSGLGFELLVAHDGEFSNALVHLPSREAIEASGGSLPVVIDAHGFTDSPRAHSKRSGLSEAAVASGAISIALGGSRSLEGAPIVAIRSHDGMNSNKGAMKRTDGPALVDFILDGLNRSLCRYTEANDLPEVTIDRDRAVAVGFSNGGALAALLAANGVVPAAISFSGPTSPDVLKVDVDGPKHVLFVAGGRDGVVPATGPNGPNSADFIPPADAAAFFAAQNGTGSLCAEAAPDFLSQHAQDGVVVEASGDAERGLVAYVHLDDLGHAVPDSAPMISPNIDERMGLASSPRLPSTQLLRDFLAYLSFAKAA